ncbi:MAG TPA: caspase family protein [Ktedonosporobacter sp.]|nr:caspase family protein [Ktedonosporobacter sp.]
MVTELRGLIVGINRYKDIHFRENPLLFARADAEEMATVIHRSSALRIEKDNLRLLINEEATRENVWYSLNQVFSTGSNFEKNTIALFYFAGHGVIDRIEGNNILLGCHNVDHIHPDQGGVRLNDIYNLAQRTSAACSIVIIDACFSGGLLGGGVRNITRVDHEAPAQLARKAMAMVKAGDDKTIAIFTACAASQAAREDGDVKHGVYTHELLRGLRDGEARDENGTVDISGLSTYLGRRFAEDYDWQGPRSVVLGGRPVALSYGEPRVPGTLQPLQIHPRAIQSLTRVEGRNILPPQEPGIKPVRPQSMQERLQASLRPGGIIAGVLLLFVLANMIFEPIRFFSLVVAFVLAILLPFAGLAMNRVFGVVLIVAQALLLAGFAFQYFHGGVSTTIPYIDGPLNFLASLLWLFWIVFVIETIGLGAFIVLALMQPLD